VTSSACPASARRTGRAAQAAGDDAEGIIMAQAVAWCRRHGGDVARMATPVRRVGPSTGATFRAVWVGQAPVDFVGVLPGGRAVYAELKTTGGASVPLEVHGAPLVRPEQVARLMACRAAGGVALVLLRLQPAAGERWFCLPVEAWLSVVADAERAGRASVPLAALVEAGWEFSRARPWLDCLLLTEQR
jgi:hypothetical protein